MYEAAPEIRELGVGITLLPHAMREYASLGLADELQRAGIENAESCFFNRFGQLIYKEPRGKAAGYAIPEVGIHRGRLHMALYRAVRDRLGAHCVETNHQCTGVEQDESGARLLFKQTTTGVALPPVAADIVIAADGVNSALRKQLVGDSVVFTGINTWRGVTRHKPILTGRSYLRIGSILTGKIVIYPIVDNVDGAGNQLINWTTEFKRDTTADERLEQAGRSGRFHFGLRELALRLARCRGADPQVRFHLRISDGRQGPARSLDLRARDACG